MSIKEVFELTEQDPAADEPSENDAVNETREPRALDEAPGSGTTPLTAGDLTRFVSGTQLALREALKDSLPPDFTSSISKIATQAAARLPAPNVDYARLAEAAGTSLRANVLGSGLVEELGRSAAQRAAFNITSGLQISDSATSLIANLDLGANSAMAEFARKASASSRLDASRLARALGENAVSLDRGASIRALTAGANASLIDLSRSVAMKELVATSGIANLLGDKMMASWRQALLSEATARSMVATIAVPEMGAGVLRDIVAVNSATARFAGRHAELNKSRMLAPARSARPTRELRGLIAKLPGDPDLHALEFASRAGRGVAGLTAADMLVTDSTIDDDAVELLDVEVVEPWMSGAETSRSVLYVRLGALNPDVPDLLRGAWQQVETDGPGAASLASHAVQEVLDRTLRAVAPDELVMRLHEAGRLPQDSTYEKDGKLRPTRTGRIAAALHERDPRESKVIAAQAKALAVPINFISRELQGGKHSSTGSVGLVRTYLVSVEAFMTQLLYEPGDG